MSKLSKLANMLLAADEAIEEMKAIDGIIRAHGAWSSSAGEEFRIPGPAMQKIFDILYRIKRDSE